MIKKYWYIGIILIISIWFGIDHYTQIKKVEKLSGENNILSVLNDTIKVYKNRLGTLSYQKEVFNTDLKALKKSYTILDKNSKELLNTISSLEREKKIITATNIKQEVVIDSLLNIKPIEVSRDLFQFSDSTKYLQYKILFNTTLPKSPSMLIKNIIIPNTLYVSHTFQEDKIIVSVNNSNDKYYKINDISSYVIPLQKKKKNNSLLYGLLGFTGGVLIMSLK